MESVQGSGRSCRRCAQMADADRIVDRRREDEDPVDPGFPAMPRLAQEAHRLRPAEDPTTKAMLEEWEGKVSAGGVLGLDCETRKGRPPPQDRQGRLARPQGHPRPGHRPRQDDPERLIGKVTLRREGRRVIAEIGGNLPGLLNLETRWVDSFGAGRGI
jgi:hypothetical protein